MVYASLVPSLLSLVYQGLRASPKGPNEQPGHVVFLPLTANDAEPEAGRREKREFQIPIESHRDLLYTVNVGIGTPPRVQKLIFDLGSSDLWVNPNCDDVQHGDRKLCRVNVPFAKEDSTTYRDFDKLRIVEYGRGWAVLRMGTDVVSLGSIRITKQTIGIAQDSSEIPFGILGATKAVEPTIKENATFIENLTYRRVIKRQAFSLDMRGAGSRDGSVIFGGLDLRKFSGSLEELAMLKPGEGYGSMIYTVQLDKVGIRRANGTHAKIASRPQAIRLDSGSTMTYLSRSLTRRIASEIPTASIWAENMAQNNDTLLIYRVDCRMRKQPGSIDFTFGKTTISIPYKDMVMTLGYSGFKHCCLGIAAMPDISEHRTILGANFLRNVYAVFDWQGEKVYLANSGDCGSKIVQLDESTVIRGIKGKCKPQQARGRERGKHETSKKQKTEPIQGGEGRMGEGKRKDKETDEETDKETDKEKDKEKDKKKDKRKQRNKHKHRYRDRSQSARGRGSPSEAKTEKNRGPGLSAGEEGGSGRKQDETSL